MYKPPGGLYLEGRFNGGFFALRVGGLIFGGAYTWRGLFSEFYGTLYLSSVQSDVIAHVTYCLVPPRTSA